MNSPSPESSQISPEARELFSKRYKLGPGSNPHKVELTLRRFIGDQLTEQAVDQATLRAVVEFGSVVYNLEAGLGRPDYITERAERNATKLGLSSEQVESTRRAAASLYVQFKNLSGLLNSTETSQDVLARMAEALETAREIEQRRIREERNKLRLRLSGQFQNLMGVSDEELRIKRCNERVNLKDDPVYYSTDTAVRKSIRTRTLGRSMYAEQLREVRGLGHTLTVSLRGINQQEFLEYAASVLNNERYLVHDFQDGRKEEISWMFTRLLTRGQISRVYVEKQGIDSDILQSRARSLLARYRMQKADEEYIRNPSSAQMRVSTRRGKDPHFFLDDGSHRRSG